MNWGSFTEWPLKEDWTIQSTINILTALLQVSQFYLIVAIKLHACWGDTNNTSLVQCTLHAYFCDTPGTSRSCHRLNKCILIIRYVSTLVLIQIGDPNPLTWHSNSWHSWIHSWFFTQLLVHTESTYFSNKAAPDPCVTGLWGSTSCWKWGHELFGKRLIKLVGIFLWPSSIPGRSSL